MNRPSSSSSRLLLSIITCAWCCCMMLRAWASRPAPSTAAAGTSRPLAGPSCCTWTRMAAGTWAAAAPWAASHARQRHQVREHTAPGGSWCRPPQQQGSSWRGYTVTSLGRASQLVSPVHAACQSRSCRLLGQLCLGQELDLEKTAGKLVPFLC